MTSQHPFLPYFSNCFLITLGDLLSSIPIDFWTAHRQLGSGPQRSPSPEAYPPANCFHLSLSGIHDAAQWGLEGTRTKAQLQNLESKQVGWREFSKELGPRWWSSERDLRSLTVTQIPSPAGGRILISPVKHLKPTVNWSQRQMQPNPSPVTLRWNEAGWTLSFYWAERERSKNPFQGKYYLIQALFSL